MIRINFKKSILNLFILGLLLICACGDFQSPRIAGAHIEGNVYFDFEEYYTDTGSVPKILLYMHTEKLYPSTGVNIVASFGEGNNNYLVFISGILAGPGFEGPAPARYRKFFNPVNGSHWVNFEYQMYHASYRFTVTDTSIVVNDTSTRFMFPEYLTYWRYPVNSFIYYYSADSNHLWVCDNFIDTLSKHIILQEFHFPVYGQICYVNHYCDPYNIPSHKYFKYQSETDFYRAREVLHNYLLNIHSQYPDVYIEIVDWKGRGTY